jgi:hypothetical protein
MQYYAYEVEETGARFEALLICRQKLSAEELSSFGHEPRYTYSIFVKGRNERRTYFVVLVKSSSDLVKVFAYRRKI